MRAKKKSRNKELKALLNQRLHCSADCTFICSHKRWQQEAKQRLWSTTLNPKSWKVDWEELTALRIWVILCPDFFRELRADPFPKTPKTRAGTIYSCFLIWRLFYSFTFVIINDTRQKAWLEPENMIKNLTVCGYIKEATQHLTDYHRAPSAHSAVRLGF